MLGIYDIDRQLHRRAFLQIGGMALGGFAFSQQLAHAAPTERHVTGKSVIYLFQQGGPSQLETFDPKPTAPDGVRTVVDTVQTALPGIRFGEPMSQLAQLADRLTIVRSFQTGNGGHNLQPLVGPDSHEANISAHYARVVGATRAESGMPTHAVAYPSAVAEDVPGPQARGDLKATGPYGTPYAPFVPGANGQLQQDMQINLPRERFFDDRKTLLAKLDQWKRNVDAQGAIGAADDLQQQAYNVLLGGGVSAALDLTRESPEVLARYDTSRFAKQGQWNYVARGKRGYYDANAASIGRLLLLARRLCEAGCGFVTIHAGYAGVWDMHADGNNLNMVDGMEAVGRSFDHAVAAFVRDVEERGLQDKIMLVCSGEMGRTPRINKRGGRDHWSKLAPLLLYGGGLRGGQVIGRSDRLGGEPAADALTPRHLISTIMQTVFDVGQLRLVQGVPAEILTMSQHAAIPAAV